MPYFDIWKNTVAALRTQGYDIVRTTDLLPATASDAEILELARVEGKVVLTQDLDFSMLVTLSNHGLPSLITLRLSSAKPDMVAQGLLDFYLLRKCLNYLFDWSYIISSLVPWRCGRYAPASLRRSHNSYLDSATPKLHCLHRGMIPSSRIRRKV